MTEWRCDHANINLTSANRSPMASLNPVQKIAQHLSTLPGEQVKAAVLAWTVGPDTSVNGLEKALASTQHDASQVEDFADDEAFTATFPSLSEAEMTELSRQTLDDYQRTGESLSQADMEAWAKTITHAPNT